MRVFGRRRFPLYLVPIIVGIGGVLVSQQVDEGMPRLMVILLSLSLAVFSAGNIIGRLHSTGIQRYLVLGGVLLLTLGALVTASPLGQELLAMDTVPETASRVSRILGLGSLFVGMCAMLVLLMRREELAEEMTYRFSSLAQHIGEGLILSTIKGRVVMVNQRFLDMTGLTEGEVVGQDTRALAMRFGLEDMLPHIDMRYRGMASEYQVPWTVNGEQRQLLFSGTPVYDPRGEPAGVMATVRDVTEQHRLARSLERYTQGLQELVEDRTRQLRQSEERLRELLVHMNEGFLTIDSDHRIRFANNRACEMLACSEDRLIGQSILDYVDTAGRIHLLELFSLVGDGDMTQGQHNLQLVTAQRREVPVVAAMARVQTDNPVDFSLVITDVAELRAMQLALEERAEQLQQANEELRQLDRTKDTFLTNVTHELRTPLSTVRGYIEMMQDGTFGEMDEKLSTAVGVMHRNAERLGVLVDEMIEFSRMEILGIQLSVTLLEPHRLVDSAAGSIQPLVRPKGITVETESAPTLPMIWGDRKRLEQLLGILLNNAAKFSHPGGTITVRAWPNDEGGVSIAVRDQGIGIKPEDQGQVFRKFFQADSSLNRRYEGAGIGLSIAQSIAEAHGGRIELASEVNRGSEFTIVLPACRFDDSLDDDLPSLIDFRVLVVDENPAFRNILCAMLEKIGCEAQFARNGYEAVRIAAEQDVSAVLLDEVVDDLAGRAVLARLRDQPATVDVPVVMFVSAGKRPLQESDSSQEFMLDKPFSTKELYRAIRAIALGEPPPGPKHTAPVTEPSGYMRVVALDNDADFLDWLVTALARRQVACRCATGLDEARELLEGEPVQALIVDLDAFDPNALRREGGDLRVIGVTSLPAAAPLAACDTILTKPFSVDALTAALGATAPAPT